MVILSVSLSIGILGKMDSEHCRSKNASDTNSSLKGFPIAVNGKNQPYGLSSKELACECRRYRFNAWVRKILWRRKWQPTRVFSPGNSHGQRSLEGYSPWGCKRVGHDLVTKQQPDWTNPSKRSLSAYMGTCCSECCCPRYILLLKCRHHFTMLVMNNCSSLKVYLLFAKGRKLST